MAGSDLFASIERRGDTRGAVVGVWVRRAVLLVALLLPIAALANVVGQEPTSRATAAPRATLTVRAPDVVRGGLLFQSRVEVVARRAIDHARLVLDDGWLEGMQISSIEPAAADEGSRDGRVVLSYGRLRAGERLIVWIQFQVDPTQPGRRRTGVTLQDSVTPVARVDRTLTVLP
jgi:hypothetical protein